MKRVNLKIKVLAAIGILTLGIFGCGSSKDASVEQMTSSVMNSASGYDAGIYVEESYELKDYASGESASVESTTESGTNGEALDFRSGRKLIRTVNMDVETLEFDNLLAYVESETKQAGGYIEEMNVYNGSRYSYSYRQNGYYNDRTASLTLRIPKDKMDDFLTEVAENSNILRRSEKEVDVTLAYVDLESHKEVLLAEQERLIALMAQAETIEDMITLESRLSEIRYQIESMESQLRTYDNQVEYSTLYLSITEVVEFTEVKPEEKSIWQRMGDGFVDSIKDIGDGLTEGFVGFVIVLPYLVLIGAIGLASFFVVLLCIKRSKKRKRNKNEEK